MSRRAARPGTKRPPNSQHDGAERDLSVVLLSQRRTQDASQSNVSSRTRLRMRKHSLTDNTTIPIMRLPPEILTLIFHALSQIDEPCARQRSRHVKSTPPSLGWLAVTHVCQRWRCVALQDPSLWAANIMIPFAFDERWANTLLSRAQSMPLTIQSSLDPLDVPLRPNELAHIRTNLTRTTCLRLHTTSTVFPALCGHAPCLRSLKLDLTTPEAPTDDLFVDGTGAPALRFLYVTTTRHLPWTSPLLANLAVLSLTSPIDWYLGYAA
ncbi:hypothetical protein FA95DRAFT_716283 [Auriscalpium vulgare]|uniref:Uncharacterized protein n=1 Tax=Auriscalpium vulgare TaxID=40419 RepID=A0ACB8RAV2_9AGAM|nr:hypothetical protein FA95DRAFT_716283 [Auriscalpium vulgare]